MLTTIDLDFHDSPYGAVAGEMSYHPLETLFVVTVEHYDEIQIASLTADELAPPVSKPYLHYYPRQELFLFKFDFGRYRFYSEVDLKTILWLMDHA